jgi:hypothetical protein
LNPHARFRRLRDRLRRSRLRRGAVAAEAAIVLPIFILAMIGIIEFGRAIMVQQILVNAAREGARRAIVPGATNDAVSDLIVGEEGYLVQAGLGAPNRKIGILDADGNAVDLEDAKSHDPIQVVVQVPHNEVGWAITSYFRDKMMKARVQMRKE